MTLRSYLDYYHIDRDDLHITVTNEGGECEDCGAGGKQFHVSGAGPTRKVCEPCARKIGGPQQSHRTEERA